jgi:hypothetical protein
MPSPMYPGGPDVDEVLAYREVVSERSPFTVFRSATDKVDIEPKLANLGAVCVTFVPSNPDAILHGQMAVERPGRDRDTVVPKFMEDYEQVVTPIHDEIDAMSEDDKFDLTVLTAGVARRVTRAGRRTLSAFAVFFASDDRQYGGLFVPEQMMGDSPVARELAPRIAAHLLPKIDAVREAW